MILSITNAEQLLAQIQQIHFDCYKLCNLAFDQYFANSGNMGVFCHGEAEFTLLTKIRESWTEPSDNPRQKYFRLIEPITVPASQNIPAATYTHLYIRKPDVTPYGKFTGDVDFYVDAEKYTELINSLSAGMQINGAQLYEQAGVGTLIQLSQPDIAAVSYVSTKEMTEKVRVKYN